MIQRWTVPANYIIGPAHTSDEGAWVLFTDAEAHAREREKAARRKALEDAAKRAEHIAAQARKDHEVALGHGFSAIALRLHHEAGGLEGLAADLRAMMEEPDDR